jgi:hypothetical protein
MLNIPLARKLFWTHPTELLGDVGHVKSRFGSFGNGVSVGARQLQGLRQTYDSIRIHFIHTRWYSKVTRLKWKPILVRLGIVLILTQDRCMVCVECTIRS